MQTHLDILLVEDQPDDRDLISHLLKKHLNDVRITCEDRRAEVIRLLRHKSFDLIIVDYHLKDYTGLELIDEIRGIRGFDVPIIVITGDESEDVALQAIQHGVDDFVIKTMKGVRDLPDTIERAIKRADIHKIIFTSENRIIDTGEIFQNLYENASELIFTIWPDGTFVNANEACLYALGLSRNDIGVKNFVEFIDGPYRGKFKSALNELLNNQKQAEIALVLTGNAGQTTSIAGHGHPHLINGKVVATNWIFRNVTPEKYMESLLWNEFHQYSGIFDYIPVAVLLGDRRGVVLQANTAAGNLLGYSPSELQGVRIEDITHPDDVPISLEYHHKLMAGQLDHYTIEKRYRRKAGEYIWTEVTGSLIRNSKREPLYGVAHIKNISDLKQFELLLGKLASDLVSVRGEYVFDRLSARLIELLRADYVFIAALTLDAAGRSCHTLLLRDRIKNVPEPELPVPEELLAELIAGDELIISNRVTRSGRKTGDFDALHAADVVAIPLRGETGAVIGALGAVYRQPTRNHSMVTTLLRIAGIKISDQLQNQGGGWGDKREKRR
jgi:PAS domain S-box-containing protein